MTNPLPDSLKPTRADIARDKELAAEAEAILGEIEAAGGGRVKVNTDTYSSVQFGADGSVVARVINDVPQQSRAEEAVARAQSAANAEVIAMEQRLAKLIAQRDETDGFDRDGKPRYLRPESVRKNLDNQARQLRLGIVNQKRLNEGRWRTEAAPYIMQEEQDHITAAELAKELEAKGRTQRANVWF